jgi:hypothetical protein
VPRHSKIACEGARVNSEQAKNWDLETAKTDNMPQCIISYDIVMNWLPSLKELNRVELTGDMHVRFVASLLATPVAA